MGRQPDRWEAGAATSREVRTAVSRERDIAIWRMFVFIAHSARPGTYKEFVYALDRLGYPTATGKGKWRISLVERYMKKNNSSPKRLLASAPARSGFVEDYDPAVYDRLRPVITRYFVPSSTNGLFRSGMEVVPMAHSTVIHATKGRGVVARVLTEGGVACRFDCCDAGDRPHAAHELTAGDLQVFVFHRRFRERSKLAEEAVRRILAGEKRKWRNLDREAR